MKTKESEKEREGRRRQSKYEDLRDPGLRMNSFLLTC